MLINNSQPSFKSRCVTVKNAQDVCRAVRNNFPYVAYSKAAREASRDILKKENIFDYLVEKTKILKEYREDRQYLKNPFKFYKEILYSTFTEKLAACYELSALAEMILRMNGVKNCTKASLVSKSGKRMNHCVTYVQLSQKYDPKKVIIIDPFLQEADFLPNMLLKYKGQYKHCLNPIHPKDTITLCLKPEKPLTDEEINILKEKYPQLIFKKELFKEKAP